MFKFSTTSYERTYFATVTLQYILRLQDEELFNSICSSMPQATRLIVRYMRHTKQLVYLTNDLALPTQNSELLTVDDTVRTLYNFTVNSEQRFICSSVLLHFGIERLIDYIDLCYKDDYVLLDRKVISTLAMNMMYQHITEFRDTLWVTIATTRTFTVVAPQGQEPYNFDSYKLDAYKF